MKNIKEVYKKELEQNYEALEIFDTAIKKIMKAIKHNVEHKKLTELNIERLERTKEVRDVILEHIIKVTKQIDR